MVHPERAWYGQAIRTRRTARTSRASGVPAPALPGSSPTIHNNIRAPKSGARRLVHYRFRNAPGGCFR